MNRRALAPLAALALLTACGTGPTQNPPTPTATAMPAATSSTTPGQATTSAGDTGTSRAGDTPRGVPAADVQRATVRRIVDGDTIELAATSPNGPALPSTQQVDVRLLEINTPETKHPSEPVQCYGKQATQRLTELAPPGSTVWVQRDEEHRDHYGRYLLYLWNANGTFVNLALVKGGYAEAKLYQPNDRHWDTISAAEQQARASNTGLWGACPYFGAPADPTPTPQPTTPPPDDGAGAYPVPSPPPDRDCSEISARDFQVRPGDPHRFDSNGDGIGCES